MYSRSVFDLDCNPVIPECGFQCPKCIEEIEATLTRIKGVSKAYIEKQREEERLIVEHDPTTVTVEELMDVLKGLPSFYEGFFIPALITDPEKED